MGDKKILAFDNSKRICYTHVNVFRKRLHVLVSLPMHLPRNRSHPTIVDVAEHAGVSIATVSRVMNKTAPVQDETAMRVLSAVEALQYHPKAAARILARQKTDTIGLLLPVISGDFFAEMLQQWENIFSQMTFNLPDSFEYGRN